MNSAHLPIEPVSQVLVKQLAKFSWPWAPGDIYFLLELQPDPGLLLAQSNEMVVVVPL